ncbi:hypothetical protein D3C72_1907970 [compost metagenome]
MPAPHLSSNDPSSTNMKMYDTDTPSATPYTPSVVSHMCDIRRSIDAPRCASTSGSQGPASA